MKQLAAFFQVRPGEGRLVALLTALMFVPSAGGAVGAPAVEALFFTRFGVAYLPHMYVTLAAVTLLTSIVITALLGRLPRRRLFLGLPLAMSLGLIAARVVVAWGPRWFYPVLWQASYLIWTLQTLVTWGLAGSLFDIRQAKRLYPLLTAGGIVGLTAGGLLTRPLVALLGTENLLLVWAAIVLVELGLVHVLSRGLPRRPPASRRVRPRPDWQRGLQQVRRSALLRWIAIAAALFSLLWYALAFPFSQAVAARFPSADALASFLGLFHGLTTAAALAASLLVANRLYARFGLMPMLLALAGLYLVGFGLLLGVDAFTGWGLFAALAVFRAAQLTWHLGVSATAFQAVFNIVPSADREQTRTFLDGVPAQIGLALVGLALLAAGPLLQPWHLHLAGAALAAVTVVVLVRANRVYGAALGQALRAGQPAVFFSDADPFGGPRLDAAAIATALRGASDPSPGVRRVAVEILGHFPPAAAAAPLVSALGDPDPEVRQAALRALPRVNASAALLEVSMQTQAPEPEVRLLAVDALRQLARFPRGLAHVLRPLLDDPHPAVRARAAAALLAAQPNPQAAAMLRAMSEDPEAHIRAVALEALVGWGDRANYDLAARGLTDPSPLVRQAAIQALPQIDRERCLIPLADALADVHPAVRTAAAESLAGIGPAALPLLTTALSDPEREDGALQALEAWPSAPPAQVLRDFARTKASLGRQYAAWHLAVNSHRPSGDRLRLLARALGEAARAQARRAVLAVGLLAPAFDRYLALDALNSPDSAQRANALEMIESWPGHDLLRPILPVLEGAAPAPTDLQPAASTLSTVLTPILYDVNAWLRACAAFAAGGTADPSLRGQLVRQSEADRDPLVRATTAAALAAHPAHPEGEPPMETLATISLLDRVVFLQRVPLFQMLATTDLGTIAAAAEERYHAPGDVIARQGEPGDELFIIVSGAVQVMDEDAEGRRVELARRAPGEYVGEMALISQEPRMASLLAADQVRVLCLGQKTFEAILRERPEIGLAVMRELCQRLRAVQAAGLAHNSLPS